MPSIDERIVSMAFENAKFEAGVAQTMRTLTKLDASLQQIGTKNSLGDIEKAANKVTLEQPMSALDKLKSRLFGAGQGASEGMNEIEKAGNKVTLEAPLNALDKVQARTAQVGVNAADGFNEIERAAGRVDLYGLNSAIDSVQSKFSALTIVATSALSTITMDATRKGLSFAKSFGLGPIQQGLGEYQTNLNSIQTILANTQGQKVSGLDNVNKALAELNTYSDKTIYNFSEMAKNIGTFTAAGVGLKESTAAIKGIANLAALSGSNSQQASTAMYQLSQAIAAGRVGLQDWNSVVNAGMGGAVFQKSLMRTAENMGALEKGAVKIDKATGKATVNGESFRNSIMAKPGQESWLTSEVLTNTLQQLTGDMTDAELAAKGFSAEQIKAIQAQAKTAQAAATEVKTLPQVFDVARETIGSGWSKTFQLIFGNFNESKKTFTALSNAINGFINKVSDARNELLGGWNEMGGRTQLLQGIENLFKGIFGYLKPIGQAFRDIFPKKTSSDLFEMTKQFAGFAKSIAPSATTVENLQRTFRGLFAVLHIGWSIIKGVVGIIGDLLGVVGQGSGGFLNFTGSIGDFLVAVDNALTKGGLLKSFFETISSILQVPVRLLGTLASSIFSLFGGMDQTKADQFGKSLDGVRTTISPLQKALIQLRNAWQNLVVVFDDIKARVSPWLSQIGQQFSGIGDAIADGIKNVNTDKIMAVLQTTFLGGIFFAIKKALGGGVNVGSLGLLDNINKTFDALTGNLQAMQQKVQAQTILLIAASIGVLAASTYILSTIDPKRLSSALTAMAVGLGELMGAVKLMTSGFGFKGIALLPVLGTGLILVAASTVVLAAAMKIFATMSWEDIAKGMAGVGGGLAAIGVGMKLLGPGSLIQGPALIGIAIALNLLALAVKQFAGMKWEDLGKGLAGVMGSLIAIALPLNALGPGLLLVGPGLIAASFGVSMLAGAVSAFSAMDPQKMAVGIIGIAAALVTLGASIGTIPPTVALQAAGLVILSVALTGIAGAIGIMGKMDVGTIIKGLAALGGALVILAVGLGAMTGTLAGSVSLMAAAAALAVLAPTLGFLGTLKWGTIFKGLAAMALALATLAIAGSLAAPGLTALGVALLPLAGVFVLTAGAVLMFAKALSLLGDTGGKGVTVMITAITAFIALLPTLAINFVKGLVEILDQMVKLSPQIVVALGKILDTVIQFVTENAPKLAIAIGVLVDSILKVLLENTPKIIAAGFKLLLDFLNGISQNIGQVVSRAATVVTKFLDSIASKAGNLATAGANFLVKFLNGISAQFPKLVGAAVNTVLKFIGAVVGQLPKVLTAGVQLLGNFITGIFSRIGKVIDSGVRVVLNIVTGIGNALPRIVKAAGEVIKKFINAVANVGPDIVDSGYKALIKFLHGIAQAIRENNKDLVDAGLDIASAIVHGIVDGLGTVAQRVIKPVIDKLFSMLPGWARKILGIHSPSKVFADIGQNIGEGLSVGLGSMNSILRRGITDPIQAMLQENKDVGEFGKFIGTEFKNGLTGGLWDDGKSSSQKTIEGAFSSLTTKLHEEQAKLRDAIKQDRDQLKQELDKDPKDRDQKQIAKLSANIAANRNLLNEATNATRRLVNNLKGTKADLIALGNSYEVVSQKLQDAKAALDEATRARDDAIRSYQGQYSQSPDINNLVSDALADAQLNQQERIDKAKKAADEAEKLRQIDQVALYKKALQEQIVATQKFQATLEKLRDLGLDDTTYKKLLEQGTKGQQFADQLLASGKSGIDELNKMNAELLAQSTQIATDAAANLYQAGVNAAAGLVKGLQDQQSEIRKTMEMIASEMVNAIKKKLKIKSPSQVFMEVGKFSAQGFVRGFRDSSGDVASAAEGVGDSALSAIQNSMRRVSDIVSGEIDSDLTITPVLDLSNVRKGAKELGDLTNVTPITAAISYGQASTISNDVAASQQVQADASVTKDVSLEFTQTITSPKALDEVEIYRQTKNQLSQVKSALGLAS